jgi:hypothetical protein
MNPTSKSPLRVVLDPVAAAINVQLMAQLKAKDDVISDKDAQLLRFQQALAASEMRAQKFEEELRLERIKMVLAQPARAYLCLTILTR